MTFLIICIPSELTFLTSSSHKTSLPRGCRGVCSHKTSASVIRATMQYNCRKVMMIKSDNIKISCLVFDILPTKSYFPGKTSSNLLL